VAVDEIAAAGVQRRNHKRLAPVGDAEVGEQRLVEDRVDHAAVIAATLALA